MTAKLHTHTCEPDGEERSFLSTAVAAKLNSVAWDFTNANTQIGAHSIHPYPAKFIPQIPRSLIDLFHPGDETAVLDPFCGSGTTLVEATECGLEAVGVDLNPLATLIAKVKTTPLTENLREIVPTLITMARRRLQLAKVAIPKIPKLDHWFKPEIQAVLAVLVAEIKNLADSITRDAMKVALSSIIVRVSNQESDTRYAAIEKPITADQVWILFRQAVANIADALDDTHHQLFSKRPRVSIMTRDIMDVDPETIGVPIGLVITSPPYPNAYEYWLYHKY